MKVYVAAHCRWAACHVADALRSAGVNVISSWHGKAFLPTETHTEQERREIAIEDASEVMDCDALVLVAGKEKYSGGKFVEAGIAIGLGKRVVVLGRRENMLLWHPLVTSVEEPEDISGALYDLSSRAEAQI